MSKRVLMFLCAILLALSFLHATDELFEPANSHGGNGNLGSSINLGQSQLEDSIGGLLEGTASSDGHFSLSYAPDFSFYKLSFQLDLKIQGKAYSDPFDITFDFSDWTLPPRTAEQSTWDYTMQAMFQYSSFIRYAQWGDRYEPIYIRFGKLAGITLGDGALLNGYFDLSVDSLTTRPGLNVTLDGSLIGVPTAGFEFVTNDIFAPTLMAWRLYALPFTKALLPDYITHAELGISYAENPSAKVQPDKTLQLHTRKLISLDIGIPLLTSKYLNLSFVTDLLFQTPGELSQQPGSATRFGIFGHSMSFFLFNTSLTIPTFGSFYTDYFDSGFELLTYQERQASILPMNHIRFDSMAALNFTKLGAYVRTRIRSDYAYGEFSNYHFQAYARIDKRLFNIVSLDLSYEKLYPTNMHEGFFEGLTTLCNVEITASAIIKIKPYSFTIGLSMIFDDQAQSSLQVDTAVRISIL